ncbi:Mur ligase middle domain protein [Thermanaerovibrio acidaminovorans DSM 6589]|uniref:Mur ligase middle domain protein n=1 Tax=Thermanaerovibrio acidaminovorans (strain ATCC 49978 / DSM 6589 / Su883) TaxID=525903 RepID=D1B9Z8_THEAS|nr:UDP-N-acetylmuramoyl-tripeptide--D-alanyl-D-alanine ligase [Thermanaerovibrio acidaminovorans]ACZ19101.1 Mur ligase middle domain protein [Thermanaerovibrio acidaminovorans DSM 6589]
MSSFRMTLGQAADLVGGILVGPDMELPRRVALDSREVLSGDLFVALRGNRTDGHAFVGQALSRGARCLLVEISKLEEIRPGLGGASCLAVPDPELALAEMASHWLKLVSPVVVGITGSVGKTTTREVILSLLGRRFKVHGSPKSYNTLIGLSATVMGMDRGCDNLVLEYGTSSFGEISKLVSYFPPDEMVITEVAPAHLERLRDVQGVLRAKLEILESQRGRFLSYNADNDLLWGAVTGGGLTVQRMGVGVRRGDVRISDRRIVWGDDGPRLNFNLHHGDRQLEVSSGLWPLHGAYPLALSWVMALRFGVEDLFPEVAYGFKPVKGRGRAIRSREGGWLMDESYNANPTSMFGAIDSTLELARGGSMRPQAVLGGMLEMGEDSSLWHRRIVDRLNGFQRVILVGDRWPSDRLPDWVVPVGSFEDALEVPMDLGEGTLTLVKGSRGYKLDLYVEAKGVMDGD